MGCMPFQNLVFGKVQDNFVLEFDSHDWNMSL